MARSARVTRIRKTLKQLATSSYVRAAGAAGQVVPLPPGFVYLVGADGAQLLGADGAPLYGAA